MDIEEAKKDIGKSIVIQFPDGHKAVHIIENVLECHEAENGLLIIISNDPVGYGQIQ